MRGYVNIPKSIFCRLCRECGSRPIVAQVSDIGYVVKCSANNEHYQTMPGLIDIEDWNVHNTINPLSIDYRLNAVDYSVGNRVAL